MALGRRLGLTGAVAVAAMLGGLAHATTIDGITFGAGANLKTSAIWEDAVETPGDTLSGIGIVTAIVGGACGGLCWSNGDNGRELTFQFTYTLEKITALDADTAEAWFSGGVVTFWSDSAEDFTFGLGGSKAIDIASATGGDEWLNLVGAPTGTVCAGGECFSADGTAINLISQFDFAGDLGAVLEGDGAGFLDVLLAGLGSANAFFDTNTQPSGQDIRLTSDFSKAEVGNFDINGSATLIVNAIPEPGTLALVGAGLLGFGWLRRRRKAA
jgi:hypothetical protein